MRILIPAVLALATVLAGSPTPPAGAASNTQCDARMSRDECLRLLRGVRNRPIEAKPVAPNTRSRYQPVPQGGGDQPGRYIVPR
jgi:hypothetical protein